MQYKLGKNPAVYDSRTLYFTDYVTPHLPAPPDSVDYGKAVPTWPMYSNDVYGDCTCAAAGHMIQSWTANAGQEHDPTDASVLKFYEALVGTPGPEAGCDMKTVLNYWHHTGLGKDKIRAYTQLEPRNHTQAKDALYMFGSVYIGVALPSFAVHGSDLLRIPWIVPPQGPVGADAPNPHYGHCIPAVAYDARNLYIVTWGSLKSMSWQFYDAYADEAYAVLSNDFIKKNNKTSAGFDLTQLDQDLAQIAQIPATRAHIAVH
jgi:hypothetical protein